MTRFETECSEMSAYKIQMRGNYPEESIQNWDYSRRSCSILAMNCHNCETMSVIHMFRALQGLLYSTPLLPSLQYLRSRAQFSRIALGLLPYWATHHTRNGSDIGSGHLASKKGIYVTEYKSVPFFAWQYFTGVFRARGCHCYDMALLLTDVTTILILGVYR